MMDSSPYFVSPMEFNIFHSIDRQLYTVLVINLWRDPVESMQIMALWLWLERMGYDNLVKKMLSLPPILINELADEAIICLNCIHNNLASSSPESNDIPLIQTLMEKEISLQYFLENQLSGIAGLSKIMNDVCVRALSDIMQQAFQRNAVQSIADNQTVISHSIHQSLVYPVPHPGGHGVGDMVQPQPQPPTPGTPTPGTEVLADDRTMFVTFSKGYPVQELEVRDFFTRLYGDCIESLHMQEVQPHEQALFARIIFHNASTIDMILRGLHKKCYICHHNQVQASSKNLVHASTQHFSLKMDSSSNGEEPTSWEELYNINLVPSELFLKFRKEMQGIRVGLNLEFYNAPINEYQAKLVLKPLAPERRWKFIYEPTHQDVRLLSKKIPIAKFLNLQVGVGHNFQLNATGWKWKLTTCLGGDGISRIRNKTSIGLFPGMDLRFGWRADYVLPEVAGTLGTGEPLFNMNSGKLQASLDRVEAILSHSDSAY